MVPTIHYTLRKKLPLTTQDEILDAPSEGDGENELHRASLEKRLANYLLDGLLSFVLFIILVVFLALLDVGDEFAGGFIVFSILVGYPLYYFVFETLLVGKTPAKYLTNTRVVDLDGYPASQSSLIIRSLCRMVPFERYSYLFNYEKGWHDVWSKTMVIDEKQSKIKKPVVEKSSKDIGHTYLK